MYNQIPTWNSIGLLPVNDFINIIDAIYPTDLTRYSYHDANTHT